MVLAPQLTESEDCTPRNWSRRRKRGTRSTTSTRGATTCAMAGLGRTATTYRPATSRPQRESSSQGGASRQECTGASTTRHASAPSSPNSGARPKMAQNFNEIKSHPGVWLSLLARRLHQYPAHGLAPRVVQLVHHRPQMLNTVVDHSRRMYGVTRYGADS